MKYKIIIFTSLISISLPVLAQQADMSLIPYRMGNLWGYANPEKKLIISPAYEAADLFYEGYACVKKADKYGYINKAGKLVISNQYYSAKHFQFGYIDNPASHKSDTVLFAGASLRKDGYEICINTSGDRMTKCPAIREDILPDQVSDNITGKVYGNVKANGDLYDKIMDDYKLGNEGDDNYYIAVKNALYGVFNNKFEIVVPFVYQMITKLLIGNDNYLMVEKNGLHGILDARGSEYIPVSNQSVQYLSRISNGKEYFIVIRDNTGTVMDTKLAHIFTGAYSKIEYDKMGGFYLTGLNGMMGYYFLNPGVSVAAKFRSIESIPGGNYIMVTTDSGKKGYINKVGAEFFVE